MRTRQVRSFLISLVVVFVIVASYALLVRPWHMRWGATDAELALALPGDRYIPPLAVSSTRAVTIHAPAEAVWPWVVQLGQGRAGFYSYEWLENLFGAHMQNADLIEPAWQHVEIGDHVSFAQDGPFARIAAIEPGQALMLEGGWSCYVVPVDENTTRLVVRYASFEVGDVLSKFFYYPIFEPVHFVMESGMMLGIKQRAEATVMATAWGR